AAAEVDAIARDVARFWRTEERNEIGHVGGVAEIAERNLASELLSALGRGMQALVDLLAVDPARSEAVHGDAVTADVAREPFRPGEHGGLGGPPRVGSGRLWRSGDVDRGGPLTLDHARQQLLGEILERPDVDGGRCI